METQTTLSEAVHVQKLIKVLESELPYYDHSHQELRGAQVSKARKLVQLKRIVEVSPSSYKILPIEGYNTRSYDVEIDEENESCNCQYNTTKHLECSHIMAVKMFMRGEKEAV